MAFPVIGGSQSGGYLIDNSVRLNSPDSAYFKRTNSSTGNRQKWTFSTWVKRTLKVDNSMLIYPHGGSSNLLALAFTNGALYMDIGGVGRMFQTNMLFRDVSAWYHIVVAFNTTDYSTVSAGQVKVYVNGIEQTFSTTTNMSLGFNSAMNDAVDIGIGRDEGADNNYADHYLAETYLIDGQQLSPTDFGEFDEDSGVWKPKQYAGTYGTNGFYLKFNNTGNMGEDSSGNDNTFTPTNLSGTTDVTTDTPTNNFATMNPLAVTTAGTATFSEGNCQVATVVSGSMGGYSTLEIPSSGVWYCEAKITTSGVTNAYIGLVPYSATDSNSFVNGNSVFYYGDGSKYVNGSNSAYGTGWSQNDIIGIKVDADSSTVEFYLNGTSQGSISHSVANMHFNCGDTNPSVSHTFQWNFGSPVYSISSGNSDANGYGNFEYSPSGGLALCTQNLATALSPTIDDASQYFNTKLYTGTGSATSITGVGFQPDFTWIKQRNNANNHKLMNSTVGSTKFLVSAEVDQEGTDTQGMTSFDSDGFSLGTSGSYNGSGGSYVSWNWKVNGGTTSSNTDGDVTSTVQVNQAAGISITTYTGNGSSPLYVGHGLGTAPQVVLAKHRNVSTHWRMWHQGLSGAGYYVILDLTNAQANSEPIFWQTPSSTTVGFLSDFSSASHNVIFWSFAEIEGYSKFGSYTGNGSTDGTFVYTGFRPAWVMIKVTDTTEDWWILDTTRDTFNSARRMLYADGTSSELNVSEEIDFLSNGFKLRRSTTGRNGSGNSYIYMAFAENPFVTSGAVPVTAR